MRKLGINFETVFFPGMTERDGLSLLRAAGFDSFFTDYYFDETVLERYAQAAAETGIGWESMHAPFEEPVNINAALEESIAAFYAELTDRNITPVIDISETAVIRDLNKAALSRIFGNILNNALKYSDGDLEISMEETGTITFTNTAAALDEVQVGRLFERFFTVETGRNSTGLGLAIAKTLAEQMGGRITAKYQETKLTVAVMF